MGPTTRHLLLAGAATALVIAAYHFAVTAPAASRPAAGGAADDAKVVAALRKEFADLRADVDRRAAAAPALAARLASLEARLAALEAGGGAGAGAKLPGTAPATPVAGPVEAGGRVWSEGQVRALEEMLAEVERRRQRDREGDQARRLVADAAPEAPEEGRAKAVAAVAAFLGRLAEVFPGGSAGSTPDERAASAARAASLRADLERDLRDVLPEAAAERVMRSIPAFASPTRR